MPGKWCGMAISNQVRELKSNAGTYSESMCILYILLIQVDAMDASLPTGTETRLLNADGMSCRLSGRETSSNRGGSSDGYGIKVPMA
jgi:hypothetical protein